MNIPEKFHLTTRHLAGWPLLGLLGNHIRPNTMKHASHKLHSLGLLSTIGKQLLSTIGKQELLSTIGKQELLSTIGKQLLSTIGKQEVLKLGSHCRSDQLDQARPSGRVLWLGRSGIDWEAIVHLVERIGREDRADIGRMSCGGHLIGSAVGTHLKFHEAPSLSRNPHDEPDDTLTDQSAAARSWRHRIQLLTKFGKDQMITT
ncbi:hypothetical protein DPMN_070466 [Dreissena polymorpha]|uniref:Uncharacterized protein n=1 Tax=Dreissena polymorpha TaxID=45954 RepID=A0A9D3Z1C2_DREPO|nr:hypothetical protein DPMN_070466 [Dreissena polymorpha]